MTNEIWPLGKGTGDKSNDVWPLEKVIGGGIDLETFGGIELERSGRTRGEPVGGIDQEISKRGEGKTNYDKSPIFSTKPMAVLRGTR